MTETKQEKKKANLPRKAKRLCAGLVAKHTPKKHLWTGSSTLTHHITKIL